MKWVILLTLLFVRSDPMMASDPETPKRDIDAVLRDHDSELLAIPNVVGVYVGVIEKTNKPCLKVMLARQPGKHDRAISNTIEGYPVITEVTGEIRPLRKP
jgi:hypothetical protein